MRLFKERLFNQWLGYGHFFRKNADWITWIYVLIPSVVFTYFFLRETVFKLEYGILAELDVYVVVALLLFGASLLKSRLFIEQADQVFFIQHPAFVSLKRWGYWYSFCLNIVLMTLGYSLLFPLLYWVKGFSTLQLVLLAIGMISSYVLCDVLDLWQRNWLRLLVKLVVIVVLTMAVMMPSLWLLLAMLITVAVTLVYIERHQIRQHRYFHQQLELDLNRAGRLFALIMQANKDMQAVKINYFNRKAPKVFTRLYAIQRESTLVELILKSIWRNRSHVRLLLQLVVIVIPLLIVLPLWMNVGLIVFGYFGLRAFINAIALEAKDHPLFKLIRYANKDWIMALQKTKRMLVWPIVSFYIVIVIVKVVVLG